MSITLAPNITYRTYRWSDWKIVIAAKGIVRPQYDDDETMYTIWGYDGPEVHVCQIWKGILPYTVTGYTQEQNDADKTDFETNVKPTANQSLEPKSASGMPQIDIINSITAPISVVFVPSVTPSGGTKVSQVVYNSISSDSDSTYVIPNGVTLVIQILTGGGDFKGQGSTIELWYDPNGTGSGMTIIDVIHVNGTSDQHSIYASYTGNGTKKIRLRRQANGGGSREVFARWEGYY